MPTLDNQTYSIGVQATANNAGTLQNTTSALTYGYSASMTTGNGISQADKIYTATRTIAASGTDPLDVNAGGLIDPLGNVFTVLRLKLIVIRAAATNTNNVVMGAGSNPITTIMGGTTPTISIRPGGILYLFAPDATAYGVTAATADVLQLANSGAGTSVTYDVLLVGSSV